MKAPDSCYNSSGYRFWFDDLAFRIYFDDYEKSGEK